MYDEDEIDDLSDEDFYDIDDDYSYLNEWRDDEDFDDYDDEESDDSEDE